MPTVPSYAGQNQQQEINTLANPPGAQGPNAVPPYPQTPQTGTAIVPPPISKVDLWSAQQLFPL